MNKLGCWGVHDNVNARKLSREKSVSTGDPESHPGWTFKVTSVDVDPNRLAGTIDPHNFLF